MGLCKSSKGGLQNLHHGEISIFRSRQKRKCNELRKFPTCEKSHSVQNVITYHVSISGSNRFVFQLVEPKKLPPHCPSVNQCTAYDLTGLPILLGEQSVEFRYITFFSQNCAQDRRTLRRAIHKDPIYGAGV